MNTSTALGAESRTEMRNRSTDSGRADAIWTNCDDGSTIERVEQCDTTGDHLFTPNSLLRRHPSHLALIICCCLVIGGCCAAPSLAAEVSPQQSIVGHHHNSSMPIIIDHLNGNSNNQIDQLKSGSLLAAHLQPASLFLAQNKSINFTHLIYDELTQSIYVGATNWLFQLAATNLRLDYALKTGPVGESSRDCSPADCSAPLVLINDLDLVPALNVHQTNDLRESSALNRWQLQRTRGNHHSHHPHHHPHQPATMHMLVASQANSSNSNGYAHLTAQRRAGGSGPQQVTPASASLTTSQPATQQQQQQQNNYQKILNIDYDSRQLIVCGSLNQGACRRHQLGKLTNFSELIPLPVASNDEHSSSVSLVVSNSGPQSSGSSAKQQQQTQLSPNSPKSILYVAATNSRLGPYRELVPAISARYLDPAQRSMQIIERSFTDSARIDISFELRDYYLVNYIYAFQHNNFVYFATVQRRSPLRQLEEWGYQTRLARLCLNDLSFQSYTEMTLECKRPSKVNGKQEDSSSSSSTSINYNLLQDAHLIQVSSSTAQQALGLNQRQGGSPAVLVGTFAQSRDHTTKSSQQSAVCLFPMEKIEQRFQENINSCYNGTTKARNMNYIAGSVNDCPKVGKTQMPTNYCNEPIKLNGSISLVSSPVISYDNELLTSITASLAPTMPINGQPLGSMVSSRTQQQQQAISRQHQVLLAGTSDGQVKRIVLVNRQAAGGLAGVEFDSIQVDESKQSPLIGDMPLIPSANPQFNQLTQSQLHSAQQQQEPQVAPGRQQFLVAATAHKIVKLPINVCKFKSSARPTRDNSTSATTANNQLLVDECQLCSQLQDPFCGWCSTTGSCSSRDDCLIAAAAAASSDHSSSSASRVADKTIHWTPFDSIKCSHYQPISPQFVPIEADQQQIVDVNVRLPQNSNLLTVASGGSDTKSGAAQLAAQLAQTQFVCHFDYLALSNYTRSTAGPNGQPRPAGATTKATQARLNLHAGTVAIGCPLPAHAQRPTGGADGLDGGQLRVRLSVRLAASSFDQQQQQPASLNHNQQRQLIEQLLAGQHQQSGRFASSPSDSNQSDDDHQPPFAIERELTFYECSAHHSCRSCLSSGSQAAQSAASRKWSCSWCPMSQRCTFNSSHLDFGCAASAIVSTTPQSAAQYSSAQQSNVIRGSHLTASLDRVQASVLGVSIERLSQCPANEVPIQSPSMSHDQSLEDEPTVPSAAVATATTTTAASAPVGGSATAVAKSSEILIPNNARRSIQVTLAKPILALQQHQKRVLKLECLIELEGAKARFSARLLDQQNVLCQETQFAYQVELATQRAQLNVILNDNQVIETIEVTFYKCHLFGVSPPALASSLSAAGQPLQSSAVWTAHELFGGPAGPWAEAARQTGYGNALQQQQRQSDCSMCANVARKYQCAWCGNTCQHSEQCTELPASTCPPPRIDSIHPNSGPLEGGTLLTIQGSNLGSNEREIQDKITVGGEPCQLVMYSVSTRIVCKTGPSLLGQQSATVFVGNRAGVTSAYEKFHYKAVHLTDVNPRIGPVSGGTRLFLSGTNLNVGSRVRILLDDNPCTIDGNHEVTSNQITCVTSPHLFAVSMRITRLTLMIDNSTHYLPYPFTYQPDPIITNIEPAESFLSGGRLILVAGRHLASPQSVKLMVYHEHKHNIINGTNCLTQNDTLITCLTPGISRELLSSLVVAPTSNKILPNQPDDQLLQPTTNEIDQQPAAPSSNPLSYESGGLKLKMMLIMDDVKSVRNLDEYYHHLPHYLTYYEDPQLFRLAQPIVEFTDELIIMGENLALKQLDQDMMITIGAHICPLKSIQAQQVVCEPAQKIAPVYDENGRLMERPVLPIVALIGSNLHYSIGHMQYNSRQYQFTPANNNKLESSNAFGAPPNQLDFQRSLFSASTTTSASNQDSSYWYSPNVIMLILLSSIGFMAAFSSAFMFGLSRFRQSKAEREYKRIQLQMGSLDMAPNGGHLSGGLFDKIHLPNGANNQHNLAPTNHHQTNVQQSMRSRAIDYVGGAFGGKKLFYQLQQPIFPPSPLTDISSLIGSSPINKNNTAQHLVRIGSDGQTIINSTTTTGTLAARNHQQPIYHGIGTNSASSSSSQSSPNSARNSSPGHQQQQQQQLFASARQQMNGQLLLDGRNNKCGNLLSVGNQQQPTNNSRNFNWTQEAPSTIVPYAVIEACNLTLEGKNAIKEYV